MSSVRSSMSAIINRVRDLIADPPGESQTFSAQQIQDTLDEHRTVVRYAPLQMVPTFAPGGALQYTDYYASPGPWEGDGTNATTTSDTNTYLVGPDWSILTPATADLIGGHWTFAVDGGHPYGQVPPVFIVGARYDMYAAAAMLLRKWAALLKLKFDVGTKSQTMARSQQLRMCLDLAAEYERKSQPTSALVTRTDLASGNISHAPVIDPTTPWW